MILQLLKRINIQRLSSRLKHTTSHTNNQIKITPVSKHLKLRETSKPNQVLEQPNVESPNLVLLFEWLYPAKSALEKYCMLYHELGLDVLSIRGEISHFLWPPAGEKLAQEIFRYLFEERDGHDNYFIHAFSVGAYNFTMCSMVADKNPETFGAFRHNIKGQIFDSIVAGSYRHMSTGIMEGKSVPRIVQAPLLKLLDTYYKVTKKQTTDVYDDLVNHFKHCPIVVPSLLIYSQNDPMCDANTMNEMMATWKKIPNFDVKSLSRKESTHAAHLKFHREDYLREWETLMKKMNFEL